MKDEKVYVEQMLDSITKIEIFTRDMNQEVFLSDIKTQSAVIMQLSIIGELVKKLSGETKQKVDLPWKEITGFRDRAIHDYFGMDLVVIWNTVITDVPVLKTELIKLKEILTIIKNG